MMVYKEILEDQLEMLQFAQAQLKEKLKTPMPSEIQDRVICRIMELSRQIRDIALSMRMLAYTKEDKRK